ncbi:SatD family protein [Mycolicibacterium rufum]|uniref:RNA polymerase subunit sigma-70 n=1 Tax=Mycolicibacterium rufum TaxID=318424 RepID=A0A9X3BSK2_9MYCO|nr:SatD family protein [Mycolicibacterium rufum]KGI69995.1 sigma-70 region 4 type 2 [Mycolicibacterium rufum]MCV7072401.1 RNA polymerase subunit sigma-70 [Mycolicibacterium rufum]ULP36246.1 SatD family protein [Mycolicibacterium rufum]
MARVKLSTSTLRATLIGDVVGSRAFADRRGLHRRLTAALATVAEDAADPPAITVGDEFQGAYRTVGLAIDAALTIRLALAPDIDVRFGIGWGAVTVLDEAGVQDGPGWWAAREAIEWTAAAQQQPGLARVRTVFRNGAGEGADPHAVNAALMCRDHLLGSLDERALRILAGMRAGRSKKELAVAEGISASAVSQRAGRAGLDLLLTAAMELREIR